MANNLKTYYIFDDFSFDEPVLLGRLYIDTIKGEESYSFEYDDNWLAQSSVLVTLDPALHFYGGRQYPNGKNIFGVFSDASPDRWGRILMKRHAGIAADKEGIAPHKLCDSDYLLRVFDESRIGGIRIKASPNGPFISSDDETSVPSWKALKELEEAARHFECDDDVAAKWVDILIRPATSLGGARPKANVMDNNGDMWIAKFPSKNDTTDAGAWEKIVHDLAGLCGLTIPESRLEKLSRYGSTFVVKRFDRQGNRRIHFASAMTLLGKTDGASANDGSSYLDIADFIRANGANPEADLVELWRRIVFNMAVHNTDDHLRNHGFILTNDGWILSPLFDVNPTPYGDNLALLINRDDSTVSIDLAISTSGQFGLSEDNARIIADEMLTIVRDNWELLAKKYGLSRSQIESMRPAFKASY